MNIRLTCYFFAFALLVLFSCKNNTKKSTGPYNDPVFQSDPQLKKITEEINNAPENASLFYQRGTLLHRMQLDTMALRDFKTACSLDSTKATYFSAVGDLLFEHKDITGSVHWLQKAIALNPEDGKARLKIAKMLLYIRQYPSAFDQINIVLRKNPHEPEAYFLKGMLYKDMKDTAKAISSFETAKSENPDYHDAYVQLGLLYSDKKNPLALQYLKDAWNIDSTDVFPIYAEGVYYQMNGDLATAKEKFRESIMHNPRYVDAYFNMGYILMQQDSVEKAFRQYDIVTRIDYLNPVGFYNRGVCYEARDSMKQAIADYRKALELDTAYKSPKIALQKLGALK